MAPLLALKLTIFATEDAIWENTLDGYVRTANALLAPYSLVLDPYPDLDRMPIILPHRGFVSAAEGTPGKIRLMAHKAYPDGHSRIPVIFCRMQLRHGYTVRQGNRQANGDGGWLDYVLINANRSTWHQDTLLHELIHAARYPGEEDSHDVSEDSAMALTDHYSPDDFAGPVQARTLRPDHVAYLKTCYFRDINTRGLTGG